MIFEFAAALPTMIETNKTDLNFDIDTENRHCDGVMSFPGHAVSIIPGLRIPPDWERQHCGIR
jgi:hypothetical protein